MRRQSYRNYVELYQEVSTTMLRENHHPRLSAVHATRRRNWLPKFILISVTLGAALYARASMFTPDCDGLDEPVAVAQTYKYGYGRYEDPQGFGPRTHATAQDPGGPADPSSFPR